MIENKQTVSAYYYYIIISIKIPLVLFSVCCTTGATPRAQNYVLWVKKPRTLIV